MSYIINEVCEIDIILSIKPKYVMQIFSGSKRYEFRKKIPKKEFNRIYVYASMPVKKIIGHIEVDRIVHKNVSELWNETQNCAGISKLEFDKYFKGKKLGYALHICKTFILEIPIDPYQEYKNFKAPQSYCYFDRSCKK